MLFFYEVLRYRYVRDKNRKGLIKLNSEHVNHAGNKYVEFVDKNNECLGCALCAMSCPDMAIYEVLK